MAVKAVHRLKQRGLKDFVCVFAGEDQGRTRYTGELWDLISATGTTDVVRSVGAVDDMPAAYAAATVVVSAAVQAGAAARDPRGAGHGAPGRGVRSCGRSGGGAGASGVARRMTGLRVPADDEAALAAALIRLFSLSDSARSGIGARGRWMRGPFRCRRSVERARWLYAGFRAVPLDHRLRHRRWPSALTWMRFVPIFARRRVICP